MIIREFGLIIVILFILAIELIAKIIHKHNSWIKYLYIIPLCVAIPNMLEGRFELIIMPAYIAAILCGGLFLLRKKKIPYIISSVLIMAIAILPLGVLIYQKQDGLNDGVYASLGYDEAFEELNNDLRQYYALSGWKNINFDEKYNEYSGKIHQAEEENDEMLYITTLREYLDSYHDGHMKILSVAELFGISVEDGLLKMKKNIANNYYGMTLIRLDTGKVVATCVEEDGSAYKAGIRNGYQIKRWNGVDIDEAIDSYCHIISITDTIFADKENEERFRPFYVSCNGGDNMPVTFVDKNKTTISTSLPTMGNGYEYLTKVLDTFNHYIGEEHEGEYVGWKILDNDHGYIYVWAESTNYEEVEETLKTGLAEMKEAGVKDIIIDVRNNTGGMDDMGATITSQFSKKEQIYIKESTYHPETDTYEITRDIYVEAKDCGLNVPIVMLVNCQTMSAGEGLTYNMKRMASVKVAGMIGTNGSFATPFGSTIMPGNIEITYPTIACLGPNDKVIIDSTDSLIGGVKPDIQIPVNSKAIRKIFIDHIDYELEYVERYLESQR